MPICIQCEYMDLKEKDKNGDAYCDYYKRYYNPYSPVCSNVVYSDSSLNNRESEYNNGSSGCYLTTAMCNVLGYDDNCYYLKMLRDFRDNYMMKDRRYYDLLLEYEVIGPWISRCIINDANTAHIMLDEYITKAIMFIRKKNYDKVIDIYKDMVNYLKDKYNMSNIIIDTTDIIYPNTNNKHTIRTLAKEVKILKK